MIKAVIEHTDGNRLQVDFGHDQTALIELAGSGTGTNLSNKPTSNQS